MNVKRRTNKPPIFIVGCGHSGTSLLLAILDAHPNIHAIPFESRLAMGDRGEAEQLLESFDTSARGEGKERWVEKTPKHIAHIGMLLHLCPDALVILMLRDGRDIACSLRDRHGSFRHAVERWVNDNKAAKAFWGHRQVYLLKYEDIIVDFEGTLRSLSKFLGEEYIPAMKQYYKKPRRYYSDDLSLPNSAHAGNHAQYRNWQINQPIFDGRNKWKSKMSDEEKNLFKRMAGTMLMEYGYADNDEW